MDNNFEPNPNPNPEPPKDTMNIEPIPDQYQMIDQQEDLTEKLSDPLDDFDSLANKLIQAVSKPNGDLSELFQFLLNNKNRAKISSAISNIFTLSESSEFQKKCPYILKKGCSDSIFLSSKQCAQLLADMFLCNINRVPSHSLNRDGDFTRVFSTDTRNFKRQKLEMIFDYFYQAPLYKNTLIFNRHLLNPNQKLSLKNLLRSSTGLCPITIREKGKVEDEKESAWVDFANKYIGGGVLGAGFVQEERMFFNNPELLVSLLFYEKLEDYEAFSINIIKENEINEIIGIDAIDFSKDHNKQFTLDSIDRELNKAVLGFGNAKSNKISTGKWGCGAFGGDPQLKFLIQWIACSLAKKEMVFYSGADFRLVNMEMVYKEYKSKTVGDLAGEIMSKLKQDQKYLDFFGSMMMKANKGWL